MQERFENFTVLITTLNRYIHKIKAEEMEEFNLKSPHVSCLYYLYKAQPITAKALCEMCKEDKASISRSIDFLETNGYLKCESATKKRYNAPLTLTEAGNGVAEKIAMKIDAVLLVAGEGLTDGDRAVLYKSLNTIEKNLEKLCKKYGE